jgi:hypothetical protein
MPANIAHMLIAKGVRSKVGEDGSMNDFSKILTENTNYMDLGALGPDLPYYSNLFSGGINMLLDRSDKPMGVDQWSYQLHSKDPNEFPLRMLEGTWRDSEDKDWDPQDHKKFAFICGFLTHMAADQIIHPIVNKIAGPYYKGGTNRELHRNCEVYQDIVLYSKITGRDIMDAAPNEWCDLNPGFGSNTEDWFRFMIQKAFIEAHAVCPTEDDVESWVDGMLLTLRGINNFGPYVKASRDFKDNKEDGEKYKIFFGDINYMDIGYKKAIDLGLIYIKAAQKLFTAENWDDRYRDNFRKVVRNADLSCPIEDNIIKAASDNLDIWT